MTSCTTWDSGRGPILLMWRNKLPCDAPLLSEPCCLNPAQQSLDIPSYASVVCSQGMHSLQKRALWTILSPLLLSR